MKKKILFLCSNMNIGGFQKSLINLLLNFDYDKYDVDLLLIEKNGIFMRDIPSEVNILEIPNLYSCFFKGINPSLKLLLKNRYYYLFLMRIVIGIINYFDKGKAAIFMSKFIPKINKEYDCCIDYNGQYLNYYMIDKVNAKRKITYFHSDYAKWDYYKNADKKYYKYADAIVTVSDICVDSMKKYFPEYADKIYCIENIITKKTVKPNFKLEHCKMNTSDMTIVTVGRVCLGKGYDFAFEAAQLLKKNKVDFHWYWIGPGNEESEVKELMSKYDINDKFYFLGPSSDPYYYLEKADIAVFPSRFEGKAVVIEETKVINKPIVVTNFSTVNNQIENMKSGLIVDMNSKSVYKGIKQLIDNPDLRQLMINYQKRNCKGNLEEKNILYSLI